MRGHDSPSLVPKRVGRFSIMEGHIYGPSSYMQARGNRLVDRIIDARDVVFMAGMVLAPRDEQTGELDLEMLMLHRVHADFLAWKGQTASMQS